jgi:hypothetical protein
MGLAIRDFLKKPAVLLNKPDNLLNKPAIS